MLTFDYVQAVSNLTHTYTGQVQQPYSTLQACATGAGIEPPFFTFHACELTNPPPRLPDVTMLPTPTYLCHSLSERSVQTIILTITPPSLPDVITLPKATCICSP